MQFSRRLAGVATVVVVVLGLLSITSDAAASSHAHSRPRCSGRHHGKKCRVVHSRRRRRTASHKGKKKTGKPAASKPSGSTNSTAQSPGSPAGSTTPSAGSTLSTPYVPTPYAGFFSPTSIWNEQVPANAAIDPNSAGIVGNLLNQEQTETNGIATTSYGVPIYTVGPTQPTVQVTLEQGAASALLQSALDAVPLPADARPAPGTDGYLVVYQPSTDTMWEFWKLQLATSGWEATWGGEMQNVSTDPGYYRNADNLLGNPIENEQWGAPATSLPLLGGTMTIGELEAGSINHALALQLANTCQGEFVAPAQRTDGTVNPSTNSNCVPEGAHFRINPSVNLASLNLPPFVYMMAVAAQKYGIVVDDRTSGIGFRAEDPYQFEQEYGYNPYMGPEDEPGTPGALFNQWPQQLMADFPWNDLQLLQMTVRTEPDTTVYTEP
jgi:hypothetical protein